jgi:hypothetical protein
LSLLPASDFEEDVVVQNNDAIQTLRGFEGAASILGQVSVRGNPSLVSLQTAHSYPTASCKTRCPKRPATPNFSLPGAGARA